MSLITPKTQNNRVIINPGTFMARCIGLIQVGTIQTEYLGEEKWLEKIRLTFETPEETHVFKEELGAQPFVISQEYTHSMGMKSNLRPIVEGMLGVALQDEEAYAFDLEELVGMECLITVVHQETKTGKKYAKIKSVTRPMKGMTIPDAINPLTILTYEKWDKDIFENLPQFIKDEMKGSKQYQEKFVTSDGVDADSIPF